MPCRWDTRSFSGRLHAMRCHLTALVWANLILVKSPIYVSWSFPGKRVLPPHAGFGKVLLCDATVTFLLDIFLARNGHLLLALLFLKGKVTIVPGGFFAAGCSACCGSASAGSLVGSAARVYCVVCRERMPSGGSYIAQIIEAFVR